MLGWTAEGGCPYVSMIASSRIFKSRIKGGGQECPPHTILAKMPGPLSFALFADECDLSH
jgi:hypothetical protein